MRLMVFLNPNVDPQGAGWNIIQSVTAIGSGGLAGKGFLQGTQSHARFIPQQSTDFIFSIIAEEWGFLGGLLLVALFCFLLYRMLGLSPARRTDIRCSSAADFRNVRLSFHDKCGNGHRHHAHNRNSALFHILRRIFALGGLHGDRISPWHFLPKV
jgi:hypothetical protein